MIIFNFKSNCAGSKISNMFTVNIKKSSYNWIQFCLYNDCHRYDGPSMVCINPKSMYAIEKEVIFTRYGRYFRKNNGPSMLSFAKENSSVKSCIYYTANNWQYCSSKDKMQRLFEEALNEFKDTYQYAKNKTI